MQPLSGWLLLGLVILLEGSPLLESVAAKFEAKEECYCTPLRVHILAYAVTVTVESTFNDAASNNVLGITMKGASQCLSFGIVPWPVLDSNHVYSSVTL